MTVRLEGAGSDCASNLTWSVVGDFVSGSSLRIQAKVSCSLKGATEEFYVTFGTPEYIQDQSGNVLGTPTVHARAKKYSYIDSSQQAVISGSGSAFSATSVATLVVVLLANMVGSAATGTFWVFMDMVQIVSYLPLLTLDMSYNLELFITQYLSTTNLVIPFNLLPDWVPDPTAYLSGFSGDILDSKFLDSGYQSFSFLYNMSSTLLTWFMLSLFYISLRFLTHCIPESK